MLTQPPSAQFDQDGVLAQLTALEQELDRLLDGLTEEQFHPPASNGGWSIAKCLEHLDLTGQGMIKEWDAALAVARPGAAAVKHPWWVRKFIAFLEPPYSRGKGKTPPAFEPAALRTRQEARARFQAMHDGTRERLERSRVVDANARVQSPFASWIKYPLGSAFELFTAHERRHLFQAENVKRDIGASRAAAR